MNSYDSIVTGALDIAQSTAIARQNTQLEPVHLLWGLLKNPRSRCFQSLKGMSKDLESRLDRLPTAVVNQAPLDIKISTELSQWLTKASARATEAGRENITEADLLVFLDDFFKNLQIHPSIYEDDQTPQTPPFLVNLNDLAHQGRLDPVIGRTREIRAVMEILGRRSKNNPVLVGDAGVGKTAVVEGLANLIAQKKVPDMLQEKTIYSLDLGGLMAGTKYRGEFEERVQDLLNFIKSGKGQNILFIDEIHQLVGAGRTDGAMDTANLLKPALARGELHCIGATTHDEYKTYILKDAALERRFRAVPVQEPSEEDAIEIMMGLKEKFEIHHGIEISEEAIFSSVFLSKSYLPERNLPDKAIDLIDEAASALKLSAEAMPTHLVEMESDIRAKKIYQRTEKSKPEIADEIALLEDQYQKEKARWEQEIQSIKLASELRNRRDRLRFELDKAQQTQNYEEASKIKYSLLPEVEQAISQSQTHWTLSNIDVAKVISRQTGIPTDKILKSRQEHILELESFLTSKVFGQNESLHEISETLIAAHAGLTDPTRPLGSFLLMGPSGVGKTETAKALSSFLFGSEESFVRLDMSEFSERHAVAKLIGAPAGYVGYEEGGVLTEAIRRKPYAVILLDEIEKAHPDFADILLQILDDGRLSDNRGRSISFRNTVILMTSNSRQPERDFKPEVLGRIDGILNYQSLDRDIMGRLVDRELGTLNERLETKQLSVDIGPSLRVHLTNQGFDQRYGARPLKSLFAKKVTRPLSHRLMQDDDMTGTWTLDLDDSGHLLMNAIDPGPLN